MPIRRKSDPTSVQCIWDAIKHLLWQKLPTETNKVVMQLIKLNGFTSEEWEKCIQEAIADNLVTIGFRRDKKTEIYKMPDINMLVLDGRDWYCFECHSAGEVVFCRNKSCPRVFHSECVTKSAVNNYRLYKNIFNNSDSTVFLKKSLPNRRKSLCLEYDGIEMVGNENIIFTKVFDNSLCTLCNIVTLDDFNMDKSELNHLLGFVLHRIRSWIPENIAHKLEGPQASPVWQTQADLSFRASHLFFENKDMSVIDANIKSKSYSKCYSFLSDVLTIIHNIGIFHGVGSQEYQATKFVLRDTLHDLGEIIGCSDCYKHSNDQINQNWFSLPCRTQHELVWAKQKGYCYWPAKVVKKGTSHYDVRFFGGKHERALLSHQFVKPISISKESLKVRKTVAFEKALEELDLHQKLSKSPAALEAFIASSVKENSPPKAEKWCSESPKKLKSPKSSVISNMVQDKELSSQKRGRPKTHTKEQSHQPLCKKGRLTMRTEKDSGESSHEAVSQKGRRSMPTKKATTVATDESSEKRDILFMPIKEGELFYYVTS
ncbi:hypothetical protein WA026_000807 [Henosepilachna vigintioctopunctata]|uniref:Uncharacterized protein n=1 Tax=Henosepilachna vigintioctopunctata TaxID=420089 RepID=A0AAW1V645_9CUCU